MKSAIRNYPQRSACIGKIDECDKELSVPKGKDPNETVPVRNFGSTVER